MNSFLVWEQISLNLAAFKFAKIQLHYIVCMDGGDRLEFPVRPALVMAAVGLVPAPAPAPAQLASFDRRNISALG